MENMNLVLDVIKLFLGVNDENLDLETLLKGSWPVSLVFWISNVNFLLSSLVLKYPSKTSVAVQLTWLPSSNHCKPVCMKD